MALTAHQAFSVFFFFSLNFFWVMCGASQAQEPQKNRVHLLYRAFLKEGPPTANRGLGRGRQIIGWVGQRAGRAGRGDGVR